MKIEKSAAEEKGGIFSKAGQRTVNSLIKLMGGTASMIRLLSDIFVSSEPQMIQGIQSKYEQYKNVMVSDNWQGLVYEIRPHKLGDKVIMAVFLVPKRVTQQGEETGPPFEMYPIEKFITNLIEPFFKNQSNV